MKKNCCFEKFILLFTLSFLHSYLPLSEATVLRGDLDWKGEGPQNCFIDPCPQ